LLESTYRTPTGPGATFIQEQVTALLEEMFR